MPSLPPLPDLRPLLRQAQAQAEALAALPGALISLTKAVRQLDGTLAEARGAILRLQRVADRLDSILDDVEQPIRDMAPGLRRLGKILDDPVVTDVPDTVRKLRDDVLPLLATLRGTSDMIDRLSGLSLLGRRRPDNPPATPTALPPADDPLPPTPLPPAPNGPVNRPPETN